MMDVLCVSWKKWDFLDGRGAGLVEILDLVIVTEEVGMSVIK
jgi:hypothetical protein